MENNWGGARTGAGRKKLSNNKKKKGYSFQLLLDDINYIDSIQGKNRSDCLKIIIEEHKNLKKQIDNSSEE